MSDWAWIAICAALTALLVYSWTRTRPEDPLPSREKPAAKKLPPEKAAEPAPAKASTTAAAPPNEPVVPRLDFEEDSDVDPTKVGAHASRPSLTPPTKKIIYDEDAANEEPTQPGALILVHATAQTDRGQRRKRNEDSVLALPRHGIYVVADGMGGYQGGEVASALAVATIENAFRTEKFDGEPHETDTIPPRASELARAIQMANDAILAKAKESRLEGMGTTICAARFLPNKQRLYIGHVGDSRAYRFRDGVLRQMTSDHTMKDLGATGAVAAHLSRAVGVWPTVPIDVLFGKPRPNDLYILCSDGLTKMVTDEVIGNMVAEQSEPGELVKSLIDAANRRGGKDNISVIAIRVVDPGGAQRPGPSA